MCRRFKPYSGSMDNEHENYDYIGWKTAESFSIKAFKLKMENLELKRRIEDLEAEIQRLERIAKY